MMDDRTRKALEAAEHGHKMDHAQLWDTVRLLVAYIREKPTRDAEREAGKHRCDGYVLAGCSELSDVTFCRKGGARAVAEILEDRDVLRTTVKTQTEQLEKWVKVAGMNLEDLEKACEGLSIDAHFERMASVACGWAWEEGCRASIRPKWFAEALLTAQREDALATVKKLQAQLDQPSREELEYTRAMALLGKTFDDALGEDLSDHVHRLQQHVANLRAVVSSAHPNP
jgi:hypothetical protein